MNHCVWSLVAVCCSVLFRSSMCDDLKRRSNVNSLSVCCMVYSLISQITKWEFMVIMYTTYDLYVTAESDWQRLLITVAAIIANVNTTASALTCGTLWYCNIITLFYSTCIFFSNPNLPTFRFHKHRLRLLFDPCNPSSSSGRDGWVMNSPPVSERQSNLSMLLPRTSISTSSLSMLRLAALSVE